MSSYLDVFEATSAQYHKLWENIQDKHTFYSYPVPRKSLKTCLEEWAEKTPDNPMIMSSAGVLTFKECNHRANLIANGLLELGCSKGDRVLLLVKNSPELILATLACFKLGAVVVVSNSRDTSWEVRRTIDDCLPRFAFAGKDSLSTLMQACYFEEGAHACSVEHLICITENDIEDSTTHLPDNVIDCAQMMSASSAVSPSVQVYPDDVQLLQYTGGTDGTPKGCSFTNYSLLAGVTCSVNYFRPRIAPEELSILLSIPMFHVYGMLLGVIVHLLAGSYVILPESVQASVEELLEYIDRFKPNLLPSVPLVIHRVVQNSELLDCYDISSLRIILSGSSPINTDIQLAFEELTGIELTDAYGLSEILASATGNPLEKRKLGSVGIPFCNTDALIVDEEGTTPVGFNEVGEIILRGPQVMREYWNQPERTAEVLRNGWLYTGDLGVIDDQGYISIVGRKKDVIIVSGSNVYPNELEQVLCEHELIEDACVIGVPDDTHGEIPKAFIVLAREAVLSEDEIRDFCREKLTRYKVPREIEFIEVIPRTKVRKPDRKALRALEAKKA